MKLTTLLPLLCFFSFSAICGTKDLPQQKSSGFKENKGQVSDQFHKARPDILFSARTGDLDCHFRANGLSYQMQRIDKWVKPAGSPNIHPIKWQVPDSVPDLISFYRVDINWLNINPSAQ